MLTISDWINLAIAIGTVGSCVVAIWLAYDSKRKKLDCVFVWREKEYYIPTLSVNNICDRTIIITNIKFEYGEERKLVGEIELTSDSEYSSFSIIEAHSKNEIPINSGVLFKGIKLNEEDERKRKLIISIRCSDGKIFKSSYEYSESDICRLFFWEGFFYSDKSRR